MSRALTAIADRATRACAGIYGRAYRLACVLHWRTYGLKDVEPSEKEPLWHRLYGGKVDVPANASDACRACPIDCESVGGSHPCVCLEEERH